MPNYSVLIEYVFDVEADSEDDAKEKVFAMITAYPPSSPQCAIDMIVWEDPQAEAKDRE